MIEKKRIQVHIAQRKELAMHKTKQKRDRNRNTTSLVLDSNMLRGRREFRLKPANLVAFKLSVFESRLISFLKIFLVGFSFYFPTTSNICLLKLFR